MLARSALHEIPDELANRMMMRHGSHALLRAINGEPEEAALPELVRPPKRPPPSSGYVPVSTRAPRPVPKVVSGIIEQVADAFEVHPDELRGDGKTRALVMARAVAIRLIRERTWESGEPKHSMLMIGGYFGRDHSTICHALNHFGDYGKRWPAMTEIYERLRERGA